MARTPTKRAVDKRREPREGVTAGLSIVIPLFNEANGLPALHRRLAEVLGRVRETYGLACEIVYVDDGSSDATLTIARSLPAESFDLQVISLSRNFGKEAALLAGLDHARHGALLFMDGDGQHPPELIETLVAHWLEQGYDVVFTAKAHRANESLTRRLSVRAFYALINLGAKQRIPEDASDFRLLSPRAVEALRRLPERNRFFKGLATWIGFRQVRIDYEPPGRSHGATTWNVRRLISLSIDALTSFSVAPLRVASVAGLVLAVVAVVIGLQLMVKTLIYGGDVPGYPSLFVGIMILGGVQLMMIGVMGEYIGKMLSEIKARPVYFVAEHNFKSAGESDRADDTRTAAE